MKTILFLNLESYNVPSGVDRCTEVLCYFIGKDRNYQLYNVRFIRGGGQLFVQAERTAENIVQITIPFPEDLVNNSFCEADIWEYSVCTSRIIYRLLPSRIPIDVLHIHNLSLSFVAHVLKERYWPTCRIVTHLHCIPWKGLYNIDKGRFNRLYKVYYSGRKLTKEELSCLLMPGEYLAYRISNTIICVSQSGVQHICKVAFQCKGKVRLVPNGLPLIRSKERKYKERCDNLALLYVGALTKSKGLFYVLDALTELDDSGLNLTVCGKVTPEHEVALRRKFPKVAIDFKGTVVFDRLTQLYESHDVGILCSLYEQCSYAVIEMLQHSMPVIYTKTDGLDEMLCDGFNGFSVDICYDEFSGLEVNRESLIEAIRKAKHHPTLTNMSSNAYETYYSRYNAEKMWKEMEVIYEYR